MFWIIVIGLIILIGIFWKQKVFKIFTTLKSEPPKSEPPKIHKPPPADLQVARAKYSTCRYLAQQGPDPRLPVNSWLQSMCKMYTDNCGDASNTAFAYNIIDQFAPGSSPWQRDDTLLDLYNTAIINFTNTNWDKSLCHPVIPCKDDKCPKDFTCKETHQPNQGSPACF
jgi:hypothetical protein